MRPRSELAAVATHWARLAGQRNSWPQPARLMRKRRLGLLCLLARMTYTGGSGQADGEHMRGYDRIACLLQWPSAVQEEGGEGLAVGLHAGMTRSGRRHMHGVARGHRCPAPSAHPTAPHPCGEGLTSGCRLGPQMSHTGLKLPSRLPSSSRAKDKT